MVMPTARANGCPRRSRIAQEALALLRCCVWAPLRISSHTHAVAMLHVTATLFSECRMRSEAHDALLAALESAVREALIAEQQQLCSGARRRAR